MSDTLIKVDNVSKKFCRSLKKSLWYGMQDLGRELAGRPHGGDGQLRPDEFWAVKDVSFEVKRGECLGLIGRNGAGKTTLLKMLNGLIKPDAGRIEMRGRVGALIALGAGFNPILTGRENIYVNASVLGLKKSEIDAKFEEIVEFAELGDFIESPVQSYSSGMVVRLGFAIAAKTEPEVLLLDEVLAVGDARFQVKCINRIRELQRSGVATILVSHNMTDIMRYTDTGIYLQDARIKAGGTIRDVVNAYLQDAPPATLGHAADSAGATSGLELRLDKLYITDCSGKVLDQIPSMAKILLHVPYRLETDMGECDISLGLGVNDMIGVLYQGSSRPLPFNGGRSGDTGEFVAEIDGLRIASGTLEIGVAAWSGERGNKIGWSRNNRVSVVTNSTNTGRVEIIPIWSHNQSISIPS